MMTTQTNRQESDPAILFMVLGMIMMFILPIVGILGTYVWEDHQEAQKTQTIELLPGAAEGYLSKYSSFTDVSRGEFLALAEGEQITMSVHERGVWYEAVAKGLRVRYFQYESPGMHYSVGREYEIRDGFLTRTLERHKLWWLPVHW